MWNDNRPIRVSRVLSLSFRYTNTSLREDYNARLLYLIGLVQFTTRFVHQFADREETAAAVAADTALRCLGVVWNSSHSPTVTSQSQQCLKPLHRFLQSCSVCCYGRPTSALHRRCRFLRAKAECFARLSHRLGVCLFVCPSVHLSHSWSVSKRCKLGSPGSRNLHCRLPQGL